MTEETVKKHTNMSGCKVEFVQSFCWFYSVPNLFVIQHLKTLYLGRNNIKVVCKRVWRIDQVCAWKGFSRLDLTIDSQLVTSQNPSHVWSMQEVEGSGQLDHYKTKSTVWPFYFLATGTYDLSQSQITRQCIMFCKKMTFHISSHTLL